MRAEEQLARLPDLLMTLFADGSLLVSRLEYDADDASLANLCPVPCGVLVLRRVEYCENRFGRHLVDTVARDVGERKPDVRQVGWKDLLVVALWWLHSASPIAPECSRAAARIK